MLTISIVLYCLAYHNLFDDKLIKAVLRHVTPPPHPKLDACADSRADHNHQAVAERANPDHKVGQRQPEFEQTDGPLAVVISIEQD